MNLYEMSEKARELYTLLENEEIDEECYLHTLESLGANEKLESYTYIQKQFEADLLAYKNEKERIEKRMKTCQNAIERMKSAVLEFMNCSGLKKAKAGTFNLSVRTFESVNITDELVIPQEYLKFQAPKVDKVAIKKALKEGLTVEGAELTKNDSLIVR